MPETNNSKVIPQLNELIGGYQLHRNVLEEVCWQRPLVVVMILMSAKEEVRGRSLKSGSLHREGVVVVDG